MPPSTGGAWYGRKACSHEPRPVPNSGWSRTIAEPAALTARRLARLTSTASAARTSSAARQRATERPAASTRASATAAAAHRLRGLRPALDAIPAPATARPTSRAALPPREPLATWASAMSSRPADPVHDYEDVGDGRRNHHLQPRGEVVRVDEGARYPLARRRNARDPEDASVAGQLRQEPEAGEEHAPGDQRQQEPREDHGTSISCGVPGAPGIGDGDDEGSEPDREPAERGPRRVGVEGERPPERPAAGAGPAREHLGVEAGRGGCDPAEHGRGQRQGRRERECNQADERCDPRRVWGATAPPLAERHGEQEKNHGRGGGHGPRLAPAQEERQPEHERLQGAEQPAIDGAHARASVGGRWSSR